MQSAWVSLPQNLDSFALLKKDSSLDSNQKYCTKFGNSAQIGYFCIVPMKGKRRITH